jgi:hypothetical protein
LSAPSAVAGGALLFLWAPAGRLAASIGPGVGRVRVWRVERGAGVRPFDQGAQATPYTAAPALCGHRMTSPTPESTLSPSHAFALHHGSV